MIKTVYYQIDKGVAGHDKPMDTHVVITTDCDVTGLPEGSILISCDTGNNEFTVISACAYRLELRANHVINGLKIGTEFTLSEKDGDK